MREQKELKRVLSPRISKLQKPQTCGFCSRVLPIGTVENSYGVIDRYHGQWERIYFCHEHSDILENISNEDLPEFQQEYLIESGFTNEFYGR